MKRDSRFAVGVDLGQAADYTAVAVVERVQRERLAQPVPELHIRHAERYPLGTPYPQQVARVAAGLEAEPFVSQSELIVDRTGVGRGVYDMLLAAGLAPIGVTITAGRDALETAPSEWSVPKRDLVAAIQAPLGEGRLKIAKELEHRALLESELKNFRIKISLAGHDSYGAGTGAEWREGMHDDLVLAVALACWWVHQDSSAGVWFA